MNKVKIIMIDQTSCLTEESFSSTFYDACYANKAFFNIPESFSDKDEQKLREMFNENATKYIVFLNIEAIRDRTIRNKIKRILIKNENIFIVNYAVFDISGCRDFQDEIVSSRDRKAKVYYCAKDLSFFRCPQNFHYFVDVQLKKIKKELENTKEINPERWICASNKAVHNNESKPIISV